MADLLELEDALLVRVFICAPELTYHEVGHILQDGHVDRGELHGLAMQQAPAHCALDSKAGTLKSSIALHHTLSRSGTGL